VLRRLGDPGRSEPGTPLARLYFFAFLIDSASFTASATPFSEAVHRQSPNQVWDTLNPENRGRLVRAVIERVEVDEPNSGVRVFIANLNPSPAAAVRAIAVNS